MDLSYIFFNAIVYGTVASCMASFFAYAKFLHLGLGSYMIGAGFVVYLFAQGRIAQAFLLLLSLLVSYILFYTLTLRHFPHEKQRDLVALITSLMLGVVIANVIQFFFGSGAIFLSAWNVSAWYLGAVFMFVSLSVYYVFERSCYSMIFKGLFEKYATMQSLGFPISRYMHVLYIFRFIGFIGIAILLLHTSGLKAVDGMFYLLKWLAIVIMVGIAHKQYIFVWALLYVLAEYFLFLHLWLPIAYKESMIMIVILVVLLIKPQWLFSIRTRSI